MSIFSANQSVNAPTQSFNQTLFKASLNRFWPVRLFKGIHAFGDQRGRVAEVALIIAGIIGTGVFGASVYFSSEGSALIFKDAYDSIVSGLGVPSQIGHAGEWSSQVIIYTLVFFQEIKKVVREGDYKMLKSSYRNFLKDISDKKDLENIPTEIDWKDFYQNLKINLNVIGPQCILPKNSLKNHLTAIRLMEELPQAMDLEMAEDRLLKQALVNVKADCDTHLKSKNYFKRLWQGLKSINQCHGRVVQVASALTGFVLPLFLSFQSFLSFVGSALVAKEVLEGVQSLSVIGHVGEWPANGLMFAYMANYFHDWSLLDQGDFVIVYKILQDHLGRLQDPENGNQRLYQRFREVANHELQRRASQCMFAVLPSQYRL